MRAQSLESCPYRMQVLKLELVRVRERESEKGGWMGGGEEVCV